MFGNKKKNESPVDQADLTRSDMGGVPENHKFFRCLNCRYVWHNKLISSCPLCGCREVTRCSEYVYEIYKRER